MILQLPVDTTGEADYTERLPLDGREYVFHFQYNQREDRWYLNILDQDSTPIVHGVKIVVGYPLTRYTLPGSLIALDLTGKNQDPGFADLGKNVALFYYV